MTVREFMAKVDSRIFKSPIVRATASFADTQNVEGVFFQQPREISLPSGAVQSLETSFECQYMDDIALLVEGDLFTVDGYGGFRFVRELLPGGDESGLTVIELGKLPDPI